MSTPKEKCNEDFQLLKSIHNYIKKKNDKIEKDENILIKYLKEPKILKDINSKNLSLFINELSEQIKKGNNIILPFIDPCYDLVEAYINSNNDNKETNFIDNEIFIQLIENSFINRKNLIPIYAYFTELYSDVDTITESDERLNKFSKMINLWNLFYSFSEKKEKKIQSLSSFCFLGTGLEIGEIIELPDDISLKIKIIFLNNNFLKYINENDDIINNSNIKYSKLLEYKKENKDDISSIYFKFKYLNKNLVVDFYVNNKILIDNWLLLNINTKKINILNNFYGQIKKIEISFNNESNNNEDNISIYPFPLKDNDGILLNAEYTFKNEKEEFNDNDIASEVIFDGSNDLVNYQIYVNNNINDKKNNIIEIILKIKDINLVKVNYINYKEMQFNIIDYFGGITQFLPFLNIINKIYNNKNIVNINEIPKQNILINFVKDILIIIFKNINNTLNYKQYYLNTYWNFYFYILNKIELFNDKNLLKIDIKEFSSYISYQSDDDIFIKIFHLFLDYINNKDKDKEKELSKSFKDVYTKLKSRNYHNLSLFGKTNSQLYRNIMKQLFIFNRLWSKQHLFFKNFPECYKNTNKNLKIKYKRINYYTSNFQQPLIYPILEINYYYPEFKKFKIDNLYKNPNDIIFKYDFSLDKYKNVLNETLVKNYLDNNDINIKDSYKCCLVKKMYHIKGEIGVIDNPNNKNFIIFFSSTKKENDEKCNKNNNKDKSEYNCELCYGSVFKCLEKDRKRLIIIPKEKIMFIILRVYYYRASGLEIFTSDNKSYYFNLLNKFELKEENIIYKCLDNYLLEIKLNDYKNSWIPYFGTQKMYKFIGWYNNEYLDVLSPLFTEEINEWNEKKYYYSNFDKLMIINLFSNRSFNDLNQYPIFPMLYNIIGETRKMDKPIGFQDLTKESKERKELIIDSYNYANDYDNEDNDEKSYFNLFYSNITYTCNYLIRVLPYSFIAIEYQGDGFDDPNRLFFSIKSTFLNTLNQRADLRELIPELFYFTPLFNNINELQLKKISNGNEIDEVIIENWKEDKIKKYKFLRDMRKDLENQEDLNLWIDLIFGVNKEFENTKEKKGRYYSKNNNINFKSDENILKNDIIMQSYDFGVLPYQLFEKPFPKKIKFLNVENKIRELIQKQFKEDHINCLINGKESFICKGEKGINEEYIKIINQIKNENNGFLTKIKDFCIPDGEKKKLNILSYLFVGDVFGNLSVYKYEKDKKIMNTNKIVYENSNDKILLNKILNNEYIPLKILTDHLNEIKYIDYNPRLNLVVDYALDGFINLYTMPTLKLIRSIQTLDFDINEKIIYVVLISNPFPMICCTTHSKIFIFDINGELINILDNSHRYNIKFYIDKNFGIFEDFITYTKKDNKECIYDLFKIN